MKMLKIIALVGIIAAAGGYEHGMFGIWAMLIRIFGFTALIVLLNGVERCSRKSGFAHRAKMRARPASITVYINEVRKG